MHVTNSVNMPIIALVSMDRTAMFMEIRATIDMRTLNQDHPSRNEISDGMARLYGMHMRVKGGLARLHCGQSCGSSELDLREERFLGSRFRGVVVTN